MIDRVRERAAGERGPIGGDGAGMRENMQYDPDHRADYEKDLDRAHRFRDAVAGYVKQHDVRIDEGRGRGVWSSTCLDLIAPADAFEPLSIDADKVVGVRNAPRLAELVAESLDAVKRGKPGSALAIGRALHYFGGPAQSDAAHTLLHAAYVALERPLLARIVDVHHRHRDLRSVDLLTV